MMSSDFLCHLETVFREVDSHLPSFSYNACGDCRVCCTAEARLGVSELEFEYVGAYLASKGREQSELSDFREYIQKKADETGKALRHFKCPLYDEEIKGCSVYPARPLPCRTFGYFMNSSTISLIPDFCALKPTTVLYDESTFFRYLPFCIPFFSLIFSYDDFRSRESGHEKQEHERI
jgi:Fe-S-cluster containining protein